MPLLAGLALAGLAALPACGNQQPVSAPIAFELPEDVAFYCVDTTTDEPVALSNCAPADLTEEAGNPPEPFALLGLVTQTATGELAAVRIAAEEGALGVIDTDVRLPGFTFAPVGEVPSAVVLDEQNPIRAFVASRGSSELHSVAIDSLRAGATGADVTLVRPSAGGEPLLPRSRPTAMQLTEDFLYVTLPELGQVMRVPVNDDGTLRAEAAETRGLSANVPAPVDLTRFDRAVLEPLFAYEYTCPSNLSPFEVAELVFPPRAPVFLGDSPEPWALALDDADPSSPRLLVSDRSLPIIHVIDLTTFTELDPIVVSVPTSELVLSPRVPRFVGGTELADPAASDRFLYAIDESRQSGGSVLVVDYDPGNPTFGAVLPARPPGQLTLDARVDRLGLPGSAQDLEILTPGLVEPLDASQLTACTDAGSGEEAGPDILRGVFLAVAATNGGVFFFDILDLDTACRGADCGTASGLDADDLFVGIARHRTRIGEPLEGYFFVEAEPVWETAGASVSVPADGAASSALAPELTPIDCGDRFRVYPEGDAALLCALADPWSGASTGSGSRTWTAAFEGTLPLTRAGAVLSQGPEPDTLVVQAPTDYCARGVLGARDVAGLPRELSLAAYPGDQLVITSDVPPAVLAGAAGDRCETITDRSSGGDITPLRLPILEASSAPGAEAGQVGRLLVGPPLDIDATVEEVLRCYPEQAVVEVRSRESLVVTSSVPPAFTHPVVRGDGGACRVSPPLYTSLQRGRAFYGVLFERLEVGFLAQAPAEEGTPTLSFTVNNVPPALAIDVSRDGQTNLSSLLSSLEYNSVDQRLYVVDQGSRGLVRIRFRPQLAVQQAFR